MKLTNLIETLSYKGFLLKKVKTNDIIGYIQDSPIGTREKVTDMLDGTADYYVNRKEVYPIKKEKTKYIFLNIPNEYKNFNIPQSWKEITWKIDEYLKLLNKKSVHNIYTWIEYSKHKN